MHFPSSHILSTEHSKSWVHSSMSAINEKEEYETINYLFIRLVKVYIT